MAKPTEAAQAGGGDDVDSSSRATAWIDARLAGLPERQRAALQSLRETIAAVAPEAEDTISYAMPAFRYHGRALVSYDAFKAHCSLFPMGSEIVERHADKFAAFSTTKGTLHFTPEQPIPKDLIQLIVRERMAQIDARRATRRGQDSAVTNSPPLPRTIAGIAVPQDEVAAATWRWAQRSLPAYLLAHSVRAYCWGAAIAAGEGWSFDGQILWTASLMHDFALTRIPRNTICFEVEGAEIARRFLEGVGLDPEAADRAATAIILHMRAGVTLADGVESVLLDRATGLDVRGDGYELVDDVRPGVLSAFPRGAFDRHFLRAIQREVAIRPTCESARLLNQNDLAGWMARSPWRAVR